jgi:transposase-like protein
MVYAPVQCPHCQSTAVIKADKQANGYQRYQCQNGQCARRIFLLQYQDRGRVPEIRRQVVDNGAQWQRSPQYRPRVAH